MFFVKGYHPVYLQVSQRQPYGSNFNSMIKTGGVPYSNSHISAYRSIPFQQPRPQIKEEPDLNSDFRIRNMGSLPDQQPRNDRERELREKEKEMKEKNREGEKKTVAPIVNNNVNNRGQPGPSRTTFFSQAEKKTDKIQIDIKKESFQQSQAQNTAEDLDDDDAQIFKEEGEESAAQNNNAARDEEEEKKDASSQNHDGSNSHNSEGEELNSNDDLSDRSTYETKNTLYCYYEKVSRVGEKWKVSLKDVIASLEEKEYLIGSVQGELIFNTSRKKY